MKNSVVEEMAQESRAKVFKVGVNLIIFVMWLFGAINTFLLSVSMFDGVSMLVYSLLLVCSVDIALVGFKWARDNVSQSDGEIKYSRLGFWYTFAVNALLVVLYQVYFARSQTALTPIIETRIALAVGIHIAAVSCFYYLWQDANPTVSKRVLVNKFKAKVNALQLEKLAASLKLDTRKIEREIELVDSIDAAQFDSELEHVTQYIPEHQNNAPVLQTSPPQAQPVAKAPALTAQDVAQIVAQVMAAQQTQGTGHTKWIDSVLDNPAPAVQQNGVYQNGHAAPPKV